MVETLKEMEARLAKEREAGMSELIPLERAVKVNLIKAAAAYRSGADSCNSVYMGGHAHAQLRVALGGGFRDSLDDLLERASDNELNAGLEACWPYIKHMREHPVDRCPCCGGLISGKTGRAV